MSEAVHPTSLSRLRTFGTWALQILLALVFFAAATAKLLSVPMMVEEFELIGFGQWFRYVTAAVEIIGGVGLLVPGFAGPAGLWLGVTMACATMAHLLVLPMPAGGAIVLMLLSLLVAFLRRTQIKAQVARMTHSISR